ncbi:MAG: sodium:solute symporter [Kiritimatiellae bacterium]|nr:sodium:solute symporter [Kiritimatiellia bacterium]
MRRALLSVLCLMSLAAGAAPLVAEQNGDQKRRYVVTVDGTNCWARAAGAEGSFRCEPVPVAPPPGAALEPVGDQHLVLKDASGRSLCYYHLVTDRWVMADRVKAQKGFGAVAWSVLAAYFVLMAGMAWYFIRKKKSAADYFTGGGRIPWYVAGMSIFATMLSSVTFLAAPAQYYISDWRYFPMTVGIFLLAPLVIYCYLPFFRGLKVASAYAYLEQRFNAAVRLFASGAYVVFMVSRVAIVTLLPALALNAMTGVSIDGCILVCGAATIVYCAFGGFEAVVWSDFVQGIVLVSGALAIFAALVCGSDGGLAGAWASASAHGKTRLLDLRFVATEPVLWVVLVLAFVENLSSYTSDQCVIQRYMSVKDGKAAARSIWFNGVFTVLVSALFCAIGTALWTYYRSHPEMLDPSLPKADSILPYFIVSGLPPALAGLVAAALFAATISTLSANLSSAATALTADFVLRFRPATPPEAQMRWGRAFTFAAGVLGIAAALVLAHTETRSLFDKFKEFISVLTAGLAGLFFIGVFIRRVGGKAAVAGLVLNYVVCFALRYAPLPFERPHVFLVGGIGFVVCVASAWVFSFAEAGGPPRSGSKEGMSE